MLHSHHTPTHELRATCGLAGFTFAGFTWPRYLANLPAGTLAQRATARRVPAVTGGYYHAPTPGAAGRGFYLGRAGSPGDGQPAPRWCWADKVPGADIKHRGWFCDDDQSQTIRGMVLHLPHGRHLAGWSMGEGMASACDAEVYTDTLHAALAADGIAETAAEREREYQAAETARMAAEEADQDANDAAMHQD